MRQVLLVAAFALVGPLAVALVAAVLVAIEGFASADWEAGVNALIFFAFWLPPLYFWLIVPFALAGLLYGASLRLGAQSSLPVALAASLPAFAAYLGAVYWAWGAETIHSARWPGVLFQPHIAVAILIAAAICWRVTRRRASALLAVRPPRGSR